MFTESRNHGTTEGQGESSITALFQSGAINIKSVHVLRLLLRLLYIIPTCFRNVLDADRSRRSLPPAISEYRIVRRMWLHVFWKTSIYLRISANK